MTASSMVGSARSFRLAVVVMPQCCSSDRDCDTAGSLACNKATVPVRSIAPQVIPSMRSAAKSNTARGAVAASRNFSLPCMRKQTCISPLAMPQTSTASRMPWAISAALPTLAALTRWHWVENGWKPLTTMSAGKCAQVSTGGRGVGVASTYFGQSSVFGPRKRIGSPYTRPSWVTRSKKYP